MPAPGWYGDSVHPAVIRWWDGATWTTHTQTNPAARSHITPEPALNYPPPSSTLAEFASPPGPADSGKPPGPRRVGSSMPISEPVRLVPSKSGSIPVAGFPGYDDPVPVPVPTPTPVPVRVPTPLGDSVDRGYATGRRALGSFEAAPLATATPMPASASTPWTSSSTFAQPTSSADLASVDYEPMTRSWGSARGTSAARAVTGVSTSGAWMLALSPLLFLGLAALGWWLTEGGASAGTTFVVSGLAVVSVLWIVVAAIIDYRRLGTLGHEFRPSVLWIVLGPFFYLLVRAIHVHRTTGKGTAPTWVYVVCAITVGAAVGAISLLLPRQVGMADLRVVETTIATELKEQGLDYSVLCPSEATATIGSSFVCTAYDEVGPVALIRVTWTGLGGAFDYSLETTAALRG